MDALWNDLRYAVRTLLRAPVFTFVALITIACGTGATTAIFSLVNAVLLEPLPYAGADRSVVLVNSWRGLASRSPYVSAPRIRAWREHAIGMRDVAVYSLGRAVNLTAAGRPQQVVAGRVTASFFQFFGARLIRGRPFTIDEDRPDGAHVAVLSHGLWQRQFGGDDTVIGQEIVINGDPATVVGILDARFDPHSLSPDVVAPPEIWLPLRLDPATRDDANTLLAVARLDSGVTIELARQQAFVAANAFRASFPGELPEEASFSVMPLKTVVVGDVGRSLLLLFGAVGLVTMIVCANTANLLLGRAAARRREFTIRVAVGASRWRLIRQLLTESIALSATGGLVGCVLGLIGIRLLLEMQVVLMPRVGLHGIADVLDVRVLLFTLISSIASGAVFGLVPAAKASREDGTIDGDLTARMRLGAGRQHRRTHSVLLIGEVSLACVLVIGSVLLIRSVAGLHGVDPGFERRNVLTMQSSLGERRLASTAGTVGIVRDGLQRIAAVPGVESAAVSLTGIPLEQGGALSVTIVGRQMDRQYVQFWDVISPQYFEVFKIRPIRGRLFTDRDEQGMPPVAIINEAMARQLWPNGDPFRERILIGQGGGPAFDENVPREIVGIVADVRQFGLDRPARPGMYVPLAQMPDAQMSFFNRMGVSATWALRTRSAAHDLTGTIQRELLYATGLPAARVRTMDDLFEAATAPMALNMWLMTAFGSLALLLAVMGIYAIATYSVHQRTHELGVRLALGARSSQVRNMVVWESMRVAFAGVIIGIVAALGLARGLTAFLFEVTAHDPLTFTIVPVTLVAAALAGVYIPARGAARVDPVIALRSE